MERLNYVTFYTLCADWLSLHGKLHEYNQPAPFNALRSQTNKQTNKTTTTTHTQNNNNNNNTITEKEILDEEQKPRLLNNIQVNPKPKQQQKIKQT